MCLDLMQEEIVKINKKIELGDHSNDPDAMITSHPGEAQEKLFCPVSQNFAFTVKNKIICSK